MISRDTIQDLIQRYATVGTHLSTGEIPMPKTDIEIIFVRVAAHGCLIIILRIITTAIGQKAVTIPDLIPTGENHMSKTDIGIKIIFVRVAAHACLMQLLRIMTIAIGHKEVTAMEEDKYQEILVGQHTTPHMIQTGATDRTATSKEVVIRPEITQDILHSCPRERTHVTETLIGLTLVILQITYTRQSISEQQQWRIM